jgi:acetolactate synthase-1/2/3 large subunit
VNLSVEAFLGAITHESRFPEVRDLTEWLSFLDGLNREYGQDREIERFVENKTPYVFLQQLNTLLEPGDVVCADVGQNQMWAAQTLALRDSQKFFTSGGLAPMGYALPVAVGAAFSDSERSIYSINGDGGFHLAVQSLMLVSQYNLPVKVIVMNNASLGMITQFQHLYFGDRMAGTTEAGGYLVPNIESLAKAYGLPYLRVSDAELSDRSWQDQLRSQRNCLVEVVIDGLTTVSPKLEYNQPINRPSPALAEDELLSALDISGLE